MTFTWCSLYWIGTPEGTLLSNFRLGLEGEGGGRETKETCFGQDLVLTPLPQTASPTFYPKREKKSRQTTNKNVFPTAATLQFRVWKRVIICLCSLFWHIQVHSSPRQNSTQWPAACTDLWAPQIILTFNINRTWGLPPEVYQISYQLTDSPRFSPIGRVI